VDLAVQAFFATLFTSIGGLAVWFLQSRAEKLRKLEEGLRDRRMELYTKALDPYIQIFAGLNDARAQAKVLANIQGYDYRKTIFHLSMFGSDEVVTAYNTLMQHIYNSGAERSPHETMRLWALVLLAIRRSAGNPDTKLNEWDMLKSTIKDLDALKKPPANKAAPAE
jgi:hypothetical protein